MSINYRASAAEFIATFALVFMGTVAITSSAVIIGYQASLIAIAFTHGLVIAIMIYSIGHISGGHINPAVTIAMIARKKIDIQNGISYIVCQLAGGITAAALHACLLPMGAGVNFGSNLPGQYNGIRFSDSTVLIVEMILTFFLVFVIFNTAMNDKAPKGWHGFAIGMTVAFDILAGGPITGAAMNPARAFGPAIISYMYGLENALQSHLMYWIGPISGGLIAAFVSKILNEDKE